MYKAILLDLDNTLYTYLPCHQHGMEVLLRAWQTELGITPADATKLYQQAQINVKQRLGETAASHNRLLYLQTFCEQAKCSALKYALKYYVLYWNAFFEKMQLTTDAVTFLQHCSNIPVCLVTDLTAHIQFRKIQALELESKISFIVTSEEVGCEKPDRRIFQCALDKLACKATDVCMIGDNFAKDIIGASTLGIDSYWLTTMTSDAAPEPMPAQVFTVDSLGEIHI